MTHTSPTPGEPWSPFKPPEEMSKYERLWWKTCTCGLLILCFWGLYEFCEWIATPDYKETLLEGSSYSHPFHQPDYK